MRFEALWDLLESRLEAEPGVSGVTYARTVPGSLEFQLSDLVALLDSLPSPGEEWAEAVVQGVAEQDEFEGFEWPR